MNDTQEQNLNFWYVRLKEWCCDVKNTRTHKSAIYLPCVQLTSLKTLYLPIRKEHTHEDDTYLLFIWPLKVSTYWKLMTTFSKCNLIRKVWRMFITVFLWWVTYAWWERWVRVILNCYAQWVCFLHCSTWNLTLSDSTPVAPIFHSHLLFCHPFEHPFVPDMQVAQCCKD